MLAERRVEIGPGRCRGGGVEGSGQSREAGEGVAGSESLLETEERSRGDW